MFINSILIIHFVVGFLVWVYVHFIMNGKRKVSVTNLFILFVFILAGYFTALILFFERLITGKFDNIIVFDFNKKKKDSFLDWPPSGPKPA